MRSGGFYAKHEKPLVEIRSKGRQGTRGEVRHEDEILTSERQLHRTSVREATLGLLICSSKKT